MSPARAVRIMGTTVAFLGGVLWTQRLVKSGLQLRANDQDLVKLRTLSPGPRTGTVAGSADHRQLRITADGPAHLLPGGHAQWKRGEIIFRYSRCLKTKGLTRAPEMDGNFEII